MGRKKNPSAGAASKVSGGRSSGGKLPSKVPAPSKVIVPSKVTVSRVGGSAPGGGVPVVSMPVVGMPFSEGTASVLERLRAALLNIFESQAGGVGSSRQAQRKFGINAKVSWQLYRVAAPGDPLLLAPHVPSAPAMVGVYSALVKHRVPAGLVTELREAHAAFSAFVTKHAGDRTSFDSMARGLSQGEGDSKHDIQHRQSMFRTCAHYWGLQLDTLLTFGIMHPRKEAARVDYANVRSKMGLRRLRGDSGIVVDTFKLSAPGDGGKDEFQREPLDGEAMRQFGAPILPAFSTKPLPKLKMTVDPDGTTCTELESETVGLAGAVDMTFGQVSRNSMLSPGSSGKGLGFGANVRITCPTALLISDMLVHRSMFGALSTFLHVYGDDVRDVNSEMRLGTKRLPFREQVQRLEAGPRYAWTAKVPRYTDLLVYTTAALGWNLDEFDLYRVQIEYPLLHTRVAMGFDVVGG